MEPNRSEPTGAAIHPNVEVVSSAGKAARLWRFFVHEYIPSFLLIPVIGIAAFEWLAAMDVFGWGDHAKCKAVMEVAHPTILATLALIALVRFALTRAWIFGWFAGVGTVLFCRELHFPGAGIILVVGGLGLAFLAWLNPVESAPLFGRRVAMSLFVTCFVCYVGSQILDRNIIKHVGRAVTGDKAFKLDYSSQIEESLETLGGSCLLIASLLVRTGTRRSVATPT